MTEETIQLPKDSYRALLHRRANGLRVDDFECHLWRREEELIRCALDYATHFKGTPLKPQHFDALLHSIAWEAILLFLVEHPDEDQIDTTILLSIMRRLDDERCGGHRGNQWLTAVLTEPPLNPAFAIQDLVVRVLQHHRLRLWRSRFGGLGQRVGSEADLPSLENDFVSAAMDIAHQVHGEGRVDQPFSDFEWDPANKTITSLVRTGIDAIDRCSGGGHGRGEMLVWGGGTSSGKCLAKGQEVLFFSGKVKKVEDVIVGDLLMGPDGRPRRVLSTNSGEAPMFDVKPTRGDPWRVNEDHILTLIGTGFERGERKRTKSGCRSGRDYGGTRWAQEVVDVSVREWRLWSNKRKHNFKLFRAGCLEFGASTRKLSLDPYFLGVLLGDGSISQSNVWVITADDEIVSALQEQATRFDLRLRVLPSKASNTAPTYSLSRKITTGRNPIMEALEKLELRGTTSGTKFIPFAYKVASRRERLAILAGLIDTDGATNLTAYDYISKSERLAEDVAFVARSLGMSAYVSKCQKTCTNNGVVGDYFRVSISGATTQIPVRIPRKRVPARKGLKDVLKVGFDVAPTGTVEEYFGFTLDSDGRFLLGDFTVTHNSYSCEDLLRRQARLKQRALYISCEDAAELMFCRTIADLSEPKVSPRDVRTKQADPEVVDRALTRLKAEYADRIHVVEMKKPTIGQVLDTIRRYRYVREIDLVIIDYLQAITEDEATTNKVQETSSVTSKLKRCFTECNVAGIVFSQYSREAYKAGTEPGLTACKYAGDIENEAEILVLMWKDPEGTLHVKLPKVKWSSAQDLRYIIPIDPLTGCQGEWEADYSENEDDDE